ncbi:hypothetical protein [Tolypothrix sp. NIES-4075]|nr:hypothetical protein [Tolypothrix sp. NIES-4075]
MATALIHPLSDFSRDVEKKERFANNIREQNRDKALTSNEMSRRV